MKRQGIKILGLALLAALSVMAVMAAGASAAKWDRNLAALSGSANIVGSGGQGELLTAGGIEINCTSVTGSGSILGLGAGFEDGVAHVTALFNGCTVLGNSRCQVYETEADALGHKNGGHITASGLGKVVEHSGVGYLKSESPKFSTFYFEDNSGLELCTLPLVNEVSGSVAFKAADALSDIAKHVVETVDLTTSELMGAQLFLGAEKAHLKAGSTATVELSAGGTFNALNVATL